MSDQSPESATSSSPEPSMEDILASIRRMIDDDDVDAVNAGEEPSSAAETAEAVLEPTALVQPIEVHNEDVPLETDIIDTPEAAVETLVSETTDNEDTVFSSFNSDFEFDDDLTIPDADIAVSSGDSAADLIDIDDLIAEVESQVNVDFAENVTETVSAPQSTVSQDADIEQIKSLMADLTDDADQDAMSADDDELNQILDDISDIEMNDDLAVEIDLDVATDDEFNVLLQIAEEAKADVKAATAGTGVAAISAAALVSTPKPSVEPETTSEPEKKEAKIIETAQEETPEMPNTAEETIIDSEVEEATTSAFASLASVVERKDNVVTSGPAIGDLVKEALQPMLKDWLDKNLKGIVERSVAKEIKRIADTK